MAAIWTRRSRPSLRFWRQSLSLAFANMKIVSAKPDDAVELTAIAFAAKRHWDYPERWIERWRDQLTVSPEFVMKHETYAAISGGRLVGFYALGRKGERAELLHIWVLPDVMGRGVGRSLFLHAVEQARAAGSAELEIESDPNAEGFYIRMGAHRVGVTISEIKGHRCELPMLRYEIERRTNRFTERRDCVSISCRHRWRGVGDPHCSPE